MSIQGIGNNSPAQKIVSQPVSKAVQPGSTQPTRGGDKVELSSVSSLLHTLKTGGDVRIEKVAAIKAQIEAGTYEDDHKLDVAADRLLDELNR